MTASDRPARQGLVHGVFVTLIAEGLGLPAGLIIAMVLTRGLGPEVYGRFTVVASTVAITEWLLIAVLARAVVKFVAEADDWKPVVATSFRVYLAGGVAIGAAFWTLAGLIATGLRDPLLADYFRLFAIQIPVFAAGAACRNILAGQARYRQQAVSSAVGWLGRMLFIVVFVYLGWGIRGAILGSITGAAGGAALAVVFVGPAVFARAGFPVRKLLQLALPAFVAMLSTRLLDQVGLLAVKALGPVEAEVGFFGAAMNVMMIAAVIASAVAPVLISSVTAAQSAGDRALLRRLAVGSIRFGFALFPFAAIVAASAGELSNLLFGDEFIATAPLMALLIFAAIARTNIAFASSVLIAVDRAWTAATVALTLPIVALAAHVILIPRFGALAGAAVTTSVAILGTLAFVAITSWICGVVPPAATLLRSAAISGLVFAAAGAWSTPGPMVLVKAAVLSLVVVAGFVISGEISREELTGLKASLLSR